MRSWFSDTYGLFKTVTKSNGYFSVNLVSLNQDYTVCWITFPLWIRYRWNFWFFFCQIAMCIVVFSNLTIFFYKVDCRVATNLPGYISIGDQKPMKVRNTLLREKLTLWSFILFISTLNMDPVLEKVLLFYRKNLWYFDILS